MSEQHVAKGLKGNGCEMFVTAFALARLVNHLGKETDIKKDLDNLISITKDQEPSLGDYNTQELIAMSETFKGMIDAFQTPPSPHQTR